MWAPSFQFLTGGGNLSSSPTQPSTGLGCEVCPGVLLALREISAMTVLLDTARREPERRYLGLKVGLFFFLFHKQESCLRRFESVDSLVGFALSRALIKPFLGKHQKSASRFYSFFLAPAEKERTIGSPK